MITPSNPTELARQHYENFPVVSWFLPKRLKKPIAYIYAFARTADDIADEGDAAPSTRIAQLDAYEDDLRLAIAGEPAPVFFQVLADIIKTHHLSTQYFYDLLSAFRQDVTTAQYNTRNELLDYCRRSANPIGRLMLELNQQSSPENNALSDNICTALQLINFWQDIGSDYYERSRIYLPLSHGSATGFSTQSFTENPSALITLLQHELSFADTLLTSGQALCQRLSGRLAWQVRLTVKGGRTILKKCQQRRHPFDRPTLKWWDFVR